MVPPPMAVRLAADLRPSADGPYSLGWDRQTDERIAVSVIAPLRRGNNIGSHDLEGGLAQSKETPCIRPPLVRSRPSPTLSHLVQQQQQQQQQRGSHKSDRRRGDDRGRAGRGGLPASIDRSAPGRCPLPCTGASWAAAPRGA